jgi:hypothetical protein
MDATTADTSAPPAPPEPPPPKVAERRAPAPPNVVARVEREDQLATLDWINEITGGDTPVKIAIDRKKPIIGANGEKLNGVLETVDETFDDDYIRETWGGGDYLLKVSTLRADGSYKYLRARTLKLAGPPKMHGQIVAIGSLPPTMVAPSHDAENELAERAFQTIERANMRAEARADKAERERESLMRQPQPGLDLAMLREINGPLAAQLAEANQTIRDLQIKLIETQNRPVPRDEFRDRLMEKAIEGETVAVNRIKDLYEARIDKIRDDYEAKISRLEDRHEAEIKRIEARHERELRTAQDAAGEKSSGVKLAYEARIDGLKSDIERLNRELGEKAARIGTLEARKDQSITEKAEELIKVQEALGGLGGGDADKAWYEKVIDGIGNSEIAMRLANKIAGGPPEQQQQLAAAPQQPQLPPPGVPFQAADGNIYVADAHGNVAQIDQGQLRQQRQIAAARKKRRAQQGAAPADGAEASEGSEDRAGGEQVAPPVVIGTPPDPADVKIAITFMENALKNNTTPAQFAQSARNLVPGGILQFIHAVGIDQFLNSVKLDVGSPLTGIRGRTFARNVFKILLEGEVAGLE